MRTAPGRRALAGVAVSVLLSLGSAASAAQAALDVASSALEREEFGEAWDLIQPLADGASVSHARAEILYRAGDFAGSLREVASGLAQDGTHMELLFRGVSVSLAIGDPEGTRDYLGRLQEAVERATLNAEDKGAWMSSVDAFSERLMTLDARAEARAASIDRARTTVFTLGFVLLGGLVLGLRGGSRPTAGRAGR